MGKASCKKENMSSLDDFLTLNTRVCGYLRNSTMSSDELAHFSQAYDELSVHAHGIWSTDNDGVAMTLATFTLTLILEMVSARSARKIMRQKNGVRLYAQAVAANLLNNGVLGPIAYYMVSQRWMRHSLPWPHSLAMIGAMLVGHCIGYYAAHRWMHTRTMYWAHRFHHRFNTNVSPIVANAVSLTEYTIAYMLPFIMGSAILQPDRLSLLIAVGIISINNLLIHTPGLSDLSTLLVPWWAVSTADHLEHHMRLTTHWAAPTISIDRLLACAFGKPSNWGKEFKEA